MDSIDWAAIEKRVTMSYHEDTIAWQAIQNIDAWLDDRVSTDYKEQSLAQDWARIAKIQEELGEVIAAFIGITGQNPRKGVTHVNDDVLNELADVALTAILAIQHFTRNTATSRDIIRFKVRKLEERILSPDSDHAI